MDNSKSGGGDYEKGRLPKITIDGQDIGSPEARSAIEKMAKNATAAQDALAKHIGGNDRLKEMVENISSAHDAMKSFKESGVAKNIRDRMKAVEDAGGHSELSKLAKRISEQHHAIEDLKPSRLSIPDLHIPENPIVETNERLARIEDQFSKFEAFAKEFATIANGLQAASAEFLQKFEAAAEKNDESADKAIKIGKQAVWMAVLIPVLIFGATLAGNYMMPDPSTAALQASVNDMNAEIETLRENQAEASERLIEALATSDAETAAALRALAAQLESPQPSAPADAN